MHGVPADLDLTCLQGAQLIQLCLGMYQVQFHFDHTSSLSVEGDWELLDVSGATIDKSLTVPRTQPFQLHLLLGQRAIRTEVFAPEWIAIQFERGELLRVFDNSRQYESFSFNGIYV